jgi:glycosyltransferase involved in cell wall biosynthesis
MDSVSGATPPTVSVLLPTHNRPEWLEQAARSVLAGAYGDVELVVSNNGRPEDTRGLAARLGDPRVRVVEQPPCGMLEHFTAALKLARGEYVAVLHDDDWWDPRFLATLVPALRRHPEAVVAFADQWQVTAEGEIDRESTEFCTRESGRGALAEGLLADLPALAVRESVPFIGCVFRRDAVSPSSFPPAVGAALDVWMGYLLAATGGAAYGSRERLAYRRMHADSDFARAATENLVAAVYCQRRMLSDPYIAAHRDELTRRLAARQQWVGATFLRDGARSAARAHLAAAVRCRPTAKGIAGWGASWVLPRSVLARL